MPKKAFPQTQAGLADALAFIEQAASCASAGAATLASEACDRIVLVAGEVLANVLDHGKAWPSAQMMVEVQRQADVTTLTIQDASPGVEASQIRASALPDNPLSVDGRGLYLIRTLSDAVEEIDGVTSRYVFRPRP